MVIAIGSGESSGEAWTLNVPAKFVLPILDWQLDAFPLGHGR